MLYRLRDGVIRLANTLRRQLEELRHDDAVTLSKMSVVKDMLDRMSNKEAAKDRRHRRSTKGKRQTCASLVGCRNRIRSIQRDLVINGDGNATIDSNVDELKSERRNEISTVAATGKLGQAKTKIVKRYAGMSDSVSDILRRINELDYRFAPQIYSDDTRQEPAFHRLRRTSAARKQKKGGKKRNRNLSKKATRKNRNFKGKKLQKKPKNKPGKKAKPQGRKKTPRGQKSGRKSARKTNKKIRQRPGNKSVAVSKGTKTTGRQPGRKRGKIPNAKIVKKPDSDAGKNFPLTVQTTKTDETAKLEPNKAADKSLPKKNGRTSRVKLDKKVAVDANKKMNQALITSPDKTVASQEIGKTRSEKKGRKKAAKARGGTGISATSKMKLNKAAGNKVLKKTDGILNQKPQKKTAETGRGKLDKTSDQKYRKISKGANKRISGVSVLKPFDIKDLELRKKIEDIFRTQSATVTVKDLQEISDNRSPFQPGKKKVPIFWQRHGKLIRLRPGKKTIGLKIGKKSRLMPGRKKISVSRHKHGKLLHLKPSKTKSMKIGKNVRIKSDRKSTKKTINLIANREFHAKAGKNTIERVGKPAAATLKSEKQKQVKQTKRPKEKKADHVISVLNIVIGEVSSVHRLSRQLPSLRSPETVKLAAKRLSRLLTSSKRDILSAIGKMSSKIPSAAVHNRLRLIDLYLLGIVRALRRGRSAVTANAGLDEYGRLERITNEMLKLIEQVQSRTKEQSVTKPMDTFRTLFVAVDSDKVVMSMAVRSSPSNRLRVTSGGNDQTQRRLELKRGFQPVFDTETLAKIVQTFEIRPEVAKQVKWRNWNACLKFASRWLFVECITGSTCLETKFIVNSSCIYRTVGCWRWPSVGV